MPESKIVARGKKVIAPTLGWDTDLVAMSADGVNVLCDDGRTYIDFASGTAVLNIGHRPAKVVEAAKAQIDKLIHSGCVFWYEPIVRLAETLAEITPGDIGMFFFSNSGAEAVEGSVKLAKYVTRRPAVISFTGGFHGRTLGAVSFTSSNVKYRTRYRPLLPEVYSAPYPYCFRCPFGCKKETCDMACMAYIKYMFQHLVKPEDVACMLIEPVAGEGGYIVPPVDFIQRLRAICDENGIMLIFDEVQTGFGRTCKWFAADHFGVTPDVMAISKAIAAGFPLSAVASRPEIMNQWDRGAHGTTFGGNPVACAAALASIETIREQKILDKGMELSVHVRKRLAQIKKKHKTVGDVRGLGLMIGVEMVKPDNAPDPDALSFVLGRLRSEGFIVIGCGTYSQVMRYIPPLNSPPELVDQSLDIVDKALAEYEKM